MEKVYAINAWKITKLHYATLAKTMAAGVIGSCEN